jgi:hypothetical protein
MARKLFADELSDIPALFHRHERSRVQGRFERCLKCGRTDVELPPTGVCARCEPPTGGWRAYRVDLQGQPVYYGEAWIPVSQLPARRYG